VHGRDVLGAREVHRHESRELRVRTWLGHAGGQAGGFGRALFRSAGEDCGRRHCPRLPKR
jgi:hypothetical protein